VVNSRRQLWSVGGFLSLVLKGLYGLEAGSDGIRFRPFITPGLRTGWFGGTDQLSLRGVPYLGKRLDVDLLLPPASAAPGCLEAARTRLNGADIGDAFFSAEDLGDGDNRLAIELRSGACGSSRITQVAVADPRSLTTAEYQRIFAPREPALDAVTSVGGRIRLDIRTSQDGVRFNIYRDGRLAAAGVRDLVWYDPDVSDPERVARCYAVEAVYPASGNTSHLSEPDCYWPAGSIHQFSVQDGSLAAPDGARIANQYGFLHFSDWGRPAQWLQTGVFSVARAGQYRVEVIYGNGFGPVTTGITATVKRVEAIDVDRGVTVAAGLVAMPQLGRWDLWGGSTFVPLALEAGPRYRLRISELFNMSYLEHFRSYTAAGIDFSAPVNRANVQMVKLLESPVAP
jgi:hypothetical protein